MKQPGENILTCNDGTCNNYQTIEDLRGYVSMLDKRYLNLSDRHTQLHARKNKAIELLESAKETLGYSCFEEILEALEWKK